MTPTHASGTRESRLRLGAGLMALAGLCFVVYAVVFFGVNLTESFLELGIGPEQVDKGKAEVEAFSPSLFHYISHLHIALSGFIAAVGVAVVALSWYGVRRGERWAFGTAVAVPVLALAVSLPAHYPWGLATIGHLGPVYLAGLIFIVGVVLAVGALRAPTS